MEITTRESGQILVVFAVLSGFVALGFIARAAGVRSPFRQNRSARGCAIKLAQSEHGSMTIELAVILPTMLLIVFYLTNLVLWAQQALQLQNAASAGAAYGAIPGHATDTTGMTKWANYNATGSTSGATGVTINSSFYYTCTPGGAQVTAGTSCSSGYPPLQYVKVTASRTVTSALGFPGVPSSLSLSESAIYRVQGTP